MLARCEFVLVERSRRLRSEKQRTGSWGSPLDMQARSQQGTQRIIEGAVDLQGNFLAGHVPKVRSYGTVVQQKGDSQSHQPLDNLDSLLPALNSHALAVIFSKDPCGPIGVGHAWHGLKVERRFHLGGDTIAGTSFSVIPIEKFTLPNCPETRAGIGFPATAK